MEVEAEEFLGILPALLYIPNSPTNWAHGLQLKFYFKCQHSYFSASNPNAEILTTQNHCMQRDYHAREECDEALLTFLEIA